MQVSASDPQCADSLDEIIVARRTSRAARDYPGDSATFNSKQLRDGTDGGRWKFLALSVAPQFDRGSVLQPIVEQPGDAVAYPELVRETVEAAGQRLFAFHFPEHTRSRVHILRMFTQFGPAAIDRPHFGAGCGLNCGNRKSLHRHHGD
jgi:hypothetical protein